jgi:hypothetical protein
MFCCLEDGNEPIDIHTSSSLMFHQFDSQPIVLKVGSEGEFQWYVVGRVVSERYVLNVPL